MSCLSLDPMKLFYMLLLALPVGSVHAQTYLDSIPSADTLVPRTLEQVVVTAEKTAERLQRVPVSVSAFTARQVRAYRLWSLEDISALVPNLYTANPGDNRNVTGIRGIVTTSYDPAVVTYVDGVNQFSLDTYIPQLLDVERIEILRGPQGTLYGRNALGGVLHVITRQPTDKTRGFAEISLGNFGQQQYNAGFSTGVIPGKLFAGIAFQYQGRDGFYTNTFTGEDYDRQTIFSGNYSLVYRPSNRWKLGLNVKHSNNRNKGAFPLAPDPVTALDEPFFVNQNALATMQDDALNGSLAVQYQADTWEMLAQTAYQSNYRVYDKPLDADFSPLDIISIFNNYGNDFNRVRVWTQEIRFSSRASDDRKWQWSAGTFLFSQDNPVKQATVFGKQAPLLGFPDSNFSLIAVNEGRNRGMAFFGQVKYRLAHGLTISAGMRYDLEQRRLGVGGSYQKEPDPPFTTVPDTSASEKFQAISPRLVLEYRPAEHHLLYLSYARGFRAGGFTPLSSDPTQPPLFAFDPEYSDNLELGWKFQGWGQRLRINTALFYTRLRDAQVPTLVLPDAITVIRNAGALESKGVEWEISLLPVKGLEVQYNAGFVDARYSSLRLSENGQEVNYDGNRQVFTPQSTQLFAVQYTIPVGLGGQYRLSLRGEWVHTGKQYFTLSNAISQDAYSLLNFRVGLGFKQYALHAWFRNAADTRYIAYAYDFGGTHLGNPRTYGATISARF
jgi:iron complex outermembrane receptor protein